MKLTICSFKLCLQLFLFMPFCSAIIFASSYVFTTSFAIRVDIIVSGILAAFLSTIICFKRIKLFALIFPLLSFGLMILNLLMVDIFTEPDDALAGLAIFPQTAINICIGTLMIPILGITIKIANRVPRR